MNESTKRTTLVDIAQRAGVSHTTVSRALRGSPQIKKSTRARIQKLADEMGYTPDPIVTALMRYRNQLIRHKSSARIAVVAGPQSGGYIERFALSFAQAANRLGYDCETYLWDPKISAKRHSNILKSRGIKGIVLGPLTDSLEQETPQINWSDFATVTLGRFVHRPKLDSVGDNPFQGIRMALDKTTQRGGRRPGLLSTQRINFHTADRLRSAYCFHMQTQKEENRVKPLFVEKIVNKQCLDSACKWIETQNLDTILSHSYIIEHLAAHAPSIPNELNFIALDIWKSQQLKNNLCGVTRDDHQIARNAIAVLNDHITHGNFGVPDSPKDLLSDNGWTDGLSRIGELRVMPQ
ncbi:MAG: LacI family DNA-binding transcriptional regulator [Verrucomicrobiota bacterium]